MERKSILDELSDDVKKVERFLLGYPIVNEYSYSFLDDTTSLTWDLSTKRVVFNSRGMSRPLVEWYVEMRVCAYKYLPTFVSNCIASRAKFIDIPAFRLAQSLLHDIISKEKA